MGRYRICLNIIILVLLFTLSACNKTDLPDESIIPYESWRSCEEVKDSNTEATFRISARYNSDPAYFNYSILPHFTIQNQEDQKLTLSGNIAQGTMPLLYGSRTFFVSYASWDYIVPMSKSYTVTPDLEQEQFNCALFGDSLTYNYSSETSNARLIEYGYEKIQISGIDMSYELTTWPDLTKPEYGALVFTGNRENRITLKRDGEEFLVRGKTAACEVSAKDNDWNDRLLGTCPAGKWTRLSYNGTEWILTKEPPSPWPWIALGVGLLLAAAASFLLYRRRKVKLPVFPEDPKHDTAEHPPEEPL